LRRVFHVKAQRNHILKLIEHSLGLGLILYLQYLCSLLITIRNIYRFIEYKSLDGRIPKET
jgi:hypothetical protein